MMKHLLLKFMKVMDPQIEMKIVSLIYLLTDYPIYRIRMYEEL